MGYNRRTRKMLRTAQHRMIGLIFQTKRKYKQNKEGNWRKRHSYVPGSARNCWRDNSVEEVQVGLGCRFLSMFGERGPSASDPVPHLGCFRAHECHHLFQIQYSFLWRKYLDMHLVDFDFDFSQLVCCLVRYDFGLYGWISSAWAFVLLSKSAIIF